MEKLIEALQIFLKYKNKTFPTHCVHEILLVVEITEEEISEDDKQKLDELKFFWSTEYDCWASFRYGSS